MFRIAQPWHPDFPEFLLRLFGEPALALVNGWGALRALAYLWALERMRRIGTALLHHGPISTEVADAVRQSARALLLCGFSVLLQLDLPRNDPPASVAVNHLPSWEFNWMAFYAVCLLGVCVLAIAHILQAAVELKAENEGFV
jgi:hypothetical protein